MIRFRATDLDMGGVVACVGAHCDDIEIGCGATLLELANAYPRIKFLWVTLCSDRRRAEESRKCARQLLGENRIEKLVFGEFRDSFLPYEAIGAKEFLIDSLKGIDPALVLTHYRRDLHQDHRFVAELIHQVCRDHLILQMEIPKYDGDLGRPNLFVPVSAEFAKAKTAALLSCYASQKSKPWFREETFLALMRLRAVECRAASGFAEAFHADKLVLT